MSYKRNGPPPKNAVRPAPPPGPPLTFSQKMREREVVALERLTMLTLSETAIGEVKRGKPDSVGCYPDATVICLHDQAGWDNFADGTKLYLSSLQKVAANTLVPDDVARGCRGLGYVTNSQASDIARLVEYLLAGISVDEAVNKIYQENEEG